MDDLLSRQELIHAPTPICVHLSSMASFRPNGLLYEDRGIQPDIVMEPEPGYFIGQSDATLKAAIEVLRTK